jgi:hypothetical protein
MDIILIWRSCFRERSNPLVGMTAFIERVLRLGRCYRISPKILVAARKID